MKVLRFIRSAAAIALVAIALPALAANTASAADYAIDNGHTSVVFKIDHLGVAPFYGMFNKVDGSFTYDPAKPGAASFTVEIAAASVFTADKKRDDHLKSPDFFNVKQFPTIKVETTRVTAGKKDGTLDVRADLTLRGVTKPVRFTVTKTGEGKDPQGNARVGFEGELQIDRMDFGVSYMPDGLGKTVTIIIAVEGVKQG